MGRLRVAKLQILSGVLIVLAIIFSVNLFFKFSKLNGPTVDQLQDFLKSNKLVVGSDVVDDFQQVYFIYDGQKVFVTSGAYNRTWVQSSDKYIVWVETADQQNTSFVYLYDVISKTAQQLSFYGNAQRPTNHGNKVVWEDRTEERSKIMYFDGKSVSNVSGDKYPSVRPAIMGNSIAFAQQLTDTDWQVVLHDTTTNNQEIVATGSGKQAWPSFATGKLTTDNVTY